MISGAIYLYYVFIGYKLISNYGYSVFIGYKLISNYGYSVVIGICYYL